LFTDADDQNTQFVGIVNQAMAKKYWPNQDPIGRHFKIGADPNHSIVVVGVAKDSRYAGMTGEIQPRSKESLSRYPAAISSATTPMPRKTRWPIQRSDSDDTRLAADGMLGRGGAAGRGRGG